MTAMAIERQQGQDCFGCLVWAYRGTAFGAKGGERMVGWCRVLGRDTREGEWCEAYCDRRAHEAAYLARVKGTAFLVARDRRAAEASAEIDWCWERCGDGEWQDGLGNRVRYVHTLEQLHGLPRGIVVYLGHDWFENREWRDLEGFAKARSIELRAGVRTDGQKRTEQ